MELLWIALVGAGGAGLWGLGLWYLAKFPGSGGRSSLTFLQEIAPVVRKGGELHGRWQGLDLSFSTDGKLTLRAPQVFPQDLVIVPKSFPIFDPESWPLEGHVDFDTIFDVEGGEERALAVLRLPFRRALAQAARWRPTLRDGAITAGLGASGDEAKRACLVAFGAIVHSWEAPSADFREDLADNARNEPVVKRAVRNLKRLRDAHPDWSGTPAVIRDVLASPRAELRLEAAALFPAEAPKVLSGVVHDGRALPNIRKAALAALLALDPVRAAREMDAMLARGGDPFQRVVLAEIRKSRGPRLIAPIKRLLRADSDLTAAAAAEALGALVVCESEGALLSALEGASEHRSLAILHALGRVGGVRAVEPLLELAGNRRGSVPDAAREAARAIQARLGNPEGGRLTVVAAEGEAGALSLTGEGTEGAVSLAGDEAGEGRRAAAAETDGHPAPEPDP